MQRRPLWQGITSAAAAAALVAVAVVPLFCRRVPEPDVDRGSAAALVEGGGTTVAPAVPMAIALECPALASAVPVRAGYRLAPQAPEGPVELWTRAPGRDWTLAAVDWDRTGSFSLHLPDGRYRVVGGVRPASDKDRSQPPVTEPAVDVTIDTQPPEARIIDAQALAPVTNGEVARARVGLQVTERGPSGVRFVEFYLTTDSGGDVRLVGTFPPEDVVEFPLPVSAGAVGLFVVAEDIAGNRGPTPKRGDKPMAVVAVGAVPFAVRLVSFEESTVLGGGSEQYLFFETSPADSSDEVGGLEVFYRLESDGEWRLIFKEKGFVERHLWKVPETTEPRCTFRVDYWTSDGRRGSTRTTHAVAIDSTLPQARITAAEDLGDGRVRVDYYWEPDAPAGVAKLWFYRKGEEGWLSLGVEEARETSLVFEFPAGPSGLKVVAEDHAGNRLLKPATDDVPDVSLTVERNTDRPLLLLENFQGGQYQGGSRRYVFWSYGDSSETLATEAFSVFYSVGETEGPAAGAGGAVSDENENENDDENDDDAWRPVATKVAATGRRVAWHLPELTGQLARVRVVAHRRDGTTVESTSLLPFLVEGRPPRVIFEGPTRSRTPETAIRFTATTAGGDVDAALEETVLKETDREDDGADTPVDTSASTADVSRRVPFERVDCFTARLPDGAWVLVGSWKPDDLRHEVSASVPVSLENGQYRVALVAWDRVGNRSTVGGREGLGRLLVDTVKPYLDVSLAEEKDLYPAGSDVLLTIRAEDEHLGNLPVSIALVDSRDGVDRVLEPYFPAGGTYRLQVPVESKPFVLKVTAADIAGNEVVFRHPFGVVPQEPDVRFTELGTPQDVRGGTKLEVRWETRLVLPEAPVVHIDFSDDGGASWSSLVDEYSNEGRWIWSVPGIDLRGGLLRITVRRDTGQEAVAVSAPLTISTTVPRVVIDRIEAGTDEEVGEE